MTNTAFDTKVEILYDLKNYGTGTTKYDDFIKTNALRFNTAWLAYAVADSDNELPEQIVNVVNELWEDVLVFIGVSDTGFDTLEELDTTIDTEEEV